MVQTALPKSSNDEECHSEPSHFRGEESFEFSLSKQTFHCRFLAVARNDSRGKRELLGKAGPDLKPITLSSRPLLPAYRRVLRSIAVAQPTRCLLPNQGERRGNPS